MEWEARREAPDLHDDQNQDEDFIVRHTYHLENTHDHRRATCENMSRDPTLLRISVQMAGGGPRTSDVETGTDGVGVRDARTTGRRLGTHLPRQEPAATARTARKFARALLSGTIISTTTVTPGVASIAP